MSIGTEKFGRYLEDFTEGDLFYHTPEHTITRQDNASFCRLTCNPHPLHLSPDYARQTRFGQIVVAGTYVFALVVGLSVPEISGKAIANLEYDKVIHHAPVFIGDTIRAQSRIINIKPSAHNKPQGVVTVETTAFKQDNTLVLSYLRKVLIPSIKPEAEGSQ